MSKAFTPKTKALRCPTCRTIVLAGSEDFPFCSDRCRLIDPASRLLSIAEVHRLHCGDLAPARANHFNGLPVAIGFEVTPDHMRPGVRKK